MTNVYPMPASESGEHGPYLAFIEGFEPLHVADGIDSLTVSIDNGAAPTDLKHRSQQLLESIIRAAFVELGAIADGVDGYDEIKITSAYPTGPDDTDAYCAVYAASARRAAKAALLALPEDDEPMFALVNHIAARYGLIRLHAAYDDEPLTPWNTWLAEYAVHVEDDMALPEKLGFELSEKAALLPAMTALSCIADIEALRETGVNIIKSIVVTQPAGGSYELSCAGSWVARALDDLYQPIAYDEAWFDEYDDEDVDEDGNEDEETRQDGDDEDAPDFDEDEAEDAVHDAIAAILEDAGFRARAKEIEKAYGVRITAYEGEPFEDVDVAAALEEFVAAARAAGEE